MLNLVDDYKAARCTHCCSEGVYDRRLPLPLQPPPSSQVQLPRSDAAASSSAVEGVPGVPAFPLPRFVKETVSYYSDWKWAVTVPLEVDLCAVERLEGVARPVGRRLPHGITVDSGAGQSVMSPDAVPEYALQPSSGQAKGQQFIGAGGERMPNMGEKRIPLMTAEGTARIATFQAASVRKPLLAVSAACDKGQMVMFDNDGSYIIERDCPEGREIRRLARQCIAKMSLERRNGVYTLPTWVVPPSQLPAEARKRAAPTGSDGDVQMEFGDTDMGPGFTRQGR